MMEAIFHLIAPTRYRMSPQFNDRGSVHRSVPHFLLSSFNIVFIIIIIIAMNFQLPTDALWFIRDMSVW